MILSNRSQLTQLLKNRCLFYGDINPTPVVFYGLPFLPKVPLDTVSFNLIFIGPSNPRTSTLTFSHKNSHPLPLFFSLSQELRRRQTSPFDFLFKSLCFQERLTPSTTTTTTTTTIWSATENTHTYIYIYINIRKFCRHSDSVKWGVRNIPPISAAPSASAPPVSGSASLY